jgi:HEPN domain-containing protein
MKQPSELARRFLSLADRDIKVFRKLVNDPDIDDEAVGFHAQQAVEKCMKAVLALHQIEFRKTHDLRALIDLLEEHGLTRPPLLDAIKRLNPFAVVLRYDFIELGALDREQAQDVVISVRRWGGEQVR